MNSSRTVHRHVPECGVGFRNILRCSLHTGPIFRFPGRRTGSVVGVTHSQNDPKVSPLL
jgi:hypothetical protein